MSNTFLPGCSKEADHNKITQRTDILQKDHNYYSNLFTNTTLDEGIQTYFHNNIDKKSDPRHSSCWAAFLNHPPPEGKEREGKERKEEDKRRTRNHKKIFETVGNNVRYLTLCGKPGFGDL